MWVKICGIRDVETAVAISKMNVDALGLNFYQPSCRYVDPQTATEIVRVLPSSVEPIGLFVNHSTEEILQTCLQTGIRTIQLHGDETIEQIVQIAAVMQRAEVDSFQIIRAFRTKQTGDAARSAYQLQVENLASLVPLKAGLIDAHVEGDYGGTGQQASWDDWQKRCRADDWKPLILAGGLTPDNVARAICIVEPWGVDVAGGVERERGVKDFTLCQQFLTAAKSVDTK